MTDQNLFDMTFKAKKQGFSVSLYCNVKTCIYYTEYEALTVMQI